MSFLLENIDHVTIKTNNLTSIKNFYVNVLGLKVSKSRPNFKFKGVWLKLKNRSIIHVIETPKIIHKGDSIDHFAFKGISIKDTKKTLNKHSIRFFEQKTPDNKNAQIFLTDPDNNKIEITFSLK